MALTRDYRETVVARINLNPALANHGKARFDTIKYDVFALPNLPSRSNHPLNVDGNHAFA